VQELAHVIDRHQRDDDAAQHVDRLDSSRRATAATAVDTDRAMGS